MVIQVLIPRRIPVHKKKKDLSPFLLYSLRLFLVSASSLFFSFTLSGLASSSFPSLLQSNPKTQKKTPKIITEFLMSFCFLPGYALNLSSSHLLEQIHLLLHFKILMRKNLIHLQNNTIYRSSQHKYSIYCIIVFPKSHKHMLHMFLD